MEIVAEQTLTAQEEDGHLQSSSFKVPPFTPTHHLRDGFLSFTEFLLRNLEEWSKPHASWPPPPPPIAFSGSDRFIKGRLSHRTIAIAASLSSRFDNAATPLSEICNDGHAHADHDNTIAKMQRDDTFSKMHEATHSDNDRVPAASTNCNTSVDIVFSDDLQKSDGAVEIQSSIGMVDVIGHSADNDLEVNADCMCSQDASSVSASEIPDVATCGADNLLLADCQGAHGSDNVTVQLLHEEAGMVQPLHNNGTPSISPKYEEGRLPLSEETVVHGGKVNTKTLVDAVAGQFLPLECRGSLPSSILPGDAGELVELPLASPSKSPQDNNLTGYTGGVQELSPLIENDNNLTGDADGFVDFSVLSSTKNYSDNNFAGDTDGLFKLSSPSPSKNHNGSNLKGEISVVPDLSLPSTGKSHNDSNLICDVDAVTEPSLPTPMDSFNNVEGLVQLSLPSPRNSDHANNSVCMGAGIAELQLPPSTTSHEVIVLQNTGMEIPVFLQQDEEVQDLEEGEVSERLQDDKCLETSDDGKAIGEGESHALNADELEPKTLDPTTDDEMNQPISMFISRYRTRSSVNPSTHKMTPLDTDSNFKTKRKTGKKRKIEEQKQVFKEITGTTMAAACKSKQAKGVQKGPSKVARACASGLNDVNSGGLSGVVCKVSTLSKIDTSKAKASVEKEYRELEAAQAGRDQVMGTPAVISSNREDGASHTHSKGLTQQGLAGSDRTVVLEAEVAVKKPKRILTKERKKKRQQRKHKKAYEKGLRGIGKLSLKPCVDKRKEKKPCHFYARGKCGKGASCTFSHDITPITKSEMCKYFKLDCCLKGDDCPYSHALSTFPCKFFHTRGKCVGADSCRFSHEPLSEEAKQKLLAQVKEEQQTREKSKVTDSGVLRLINPKDSVLPSDLEIFPLGRDRAKKTPCKVTDAAASKISRLAGITSIHNNISENPMLVAAKKAASTVTGGGIGINATNLDGNKYLLSGGSLDPTGPLADTSSEKSLTPMSQSTRPEIGGLLAQATGFLSNSIMPQDRKAKVDAFLHTQLDNFHLMQKSKLGMGLESLGGCYTLSNQPRALSMGQTSPFKALNTSLSRDPSAKAIHAADGSQLISTLKPTICADTAPNSDFSGDQLKSVPNGKSIGIDASVPNPPILGPSLLEMISMSQRATLSKGPASTSGLLATTTNATSKRSAANVFLDRFLKG